MLRESLHLLLEADMALKGSGWSHGLFWTSSSPSCCWPPGGAGMIRVKEAIVVEGKYDKIKLSSLVEGVIIETKGFGIFRDREKLAYLRALAKSGGLLC